MRKGVRIDTLLFWLCMALWSSTNCFAASAVTLVASVWLVTNFCIRLLINSWSSLLTLFSNSPRDSFRLSWCLFTTSFCGCLWLFRMSFVKGLLFENIGIKKLTLKELSKIVLVSYFIDVLFLLICSNRHFFQLINLVQLPFSFLDGFHMVKFGLKT